MLPEITAISCFVSMKAVTHITEKCVPLLDMRGVLGGGMARRCVLQRLAASVKNPCWQVPLLGTCWHGASGTGRHHKERIVRSKMPRIVVIVCWRRFKGHLASWSPEPSPTASAGTVCCLSERRADGGLTSSDRYLAETKAGVAASALQGGTSARHSELLQSKCACCCGTCLSCHKLP
jgi:hypothetical protein